MAFMHEFPYAREIDSDLRELLDYVKQYKDITKEWEDFQKSVQEDINEIRTELEGAEERLAGQITAVQRKAEQDLLAATDKLQGEIDTINQWIQDFSADYLIELIQKYIRTMIFVEIDNSGHIVYYIPETWEDITFLTAGLDVFDTGLDYGTLILEY